MKQNLKKEDTKETVNEKVKEVYDKLAAKSDDGGVTPHALLNASRKEDSLLHSRFNWNNSDAGEKFRIWQARELLNSMTVEIDGSPVKGYQSLVIEVNEQKVHKYYSVNTIMSSEELKKKALTQLAKNVRSTLKAYAKHKEVYELVSEASLKALEKEMGII